MLEEVTVFMDPYLGIHTNPDQIALADRLTECFREDIVLREQQRSKELKQEMLEVVQLKNSKTMEKQPEKAKYSASEAIESKLNNVRERERLREKKENNKEKQAEKVMNITVKSSKNKQTQAGDVCEMTTEQKHSAVINKEQRKQDIPGHMTNKEAKEMIEQECGKAAHAHKTKLPDYVKTDCLQEQDTAIMEKDILTEKSRMTSHSEPMKKIDPKGQNGEFMKTQKQEMRFGVKGPDANKTQDDTDNISQCGAKENLYLKPISTEERQSMNTTAIKQEEEHIYEEPDVVLYSSSEYITEIECVKEQLRQLENVTLHIAVTGSTGAGKSTFINAIRGLENDDVNAAHTGATETTMTSTMYPHPTMPSVIFWDLPGTGSPKFKAKKYLKEVKLDTFDFFIIISSERFKENDIMLAKAIKERKKLFYLIRSKIDNDIQAESQKKHFDEQEMLSQIREDCQRNLMDMDNPDVFLISSFELHKYDFKTLVNMLEKQLPAHKKDALIMSLPIYSSKILEEKIKMFMEKTRSAAIASGSIAVAPVPGLSMACDAAILLGFFTKCYNAFGLDDESVKKLSERVNNPHLKDVRRSPLVVAIGQKKLSHKELSALMGKEAAVKFAWSMVPVVGSKKTAEMSYSATLNLLRAGLQDLADTAREVLKTAGLTGVY